MPGIWRELTFLAGLGGEFTDRFRLPWAAVRFHVANGLGLSKHLLQKPAEDFRLNILGGAYPMRLRPYNGDWFIFLNTLFDGRYADVAKLVTPIRTVVDLGCHVGSSTLSFALLAPQAHFFCLEANPQNVALLTHNLAGLGPRARILSGALSEKPGPLRFGDHGYSWGGRVNGQGSNTYEVRGYTISEVIEKSGFPVIDVLKVHVEGAERFIFKPSERAALARVRMMVVAEFHDPDFAEEQILDEAAHFGFRPLAGAQLPTQFLALENCECAPAR